MALNKPFVSQATAIASYDFVDVEEGAGIVNYNASSFKVTTTTTYGMTRTTNFSDEVYTWVNASDASFT
ncbi:hypothetical protein LCGC14_3164750, partial [marine sediment metagenome]